MNTRRGLFVSVDGPSGVGKSTTVRRLGERLTAVGVAHHLTAEPTDSHLGRLAYDAVGSSSGPILACLFAADRYLHLERVIRPRAAAGEIVISDRYLAAGLVMQQLDGMKLDWLRQVNAHADPPDLAVILTAEPGVLAARLAARGAKNHYQRRPDISAREAALYEEAADMLAAAGTRVLRLDTSQQDAETVAAIIHRHIDQLQAEAKPVVPAQAREAQE
ncbi:hypothetical protein TH66_11080 [Carbonactinospora thermoautotrophica]|uniref:Thymidylate kinase n=1 Tax=Carbonactinospora thermoautotrophica TaxID=1469144 RepID=A0A132MZU8_9ACTN|nr:dTMP kinase [Carbonactinospora thermoautotrophica]KWX02275.1 Thymidylate kinase [Carbonactinospora thermoautotrophica]KWX03445.1 hypothetical protein TH66_11080 [Carbonactinospora thermoautotrophica]KWX06557.1 hypothetical protein TR74_21625 [Carbonactinospora thermoautotrophica]